MYWICYSMASSPNSDWQCWIQLLKAFPNKKVFSFERNNFRDKLVTVEEQWKIENKRTDLWSKRNENWSVEVVDAECHVLSPAALYKQFRTELLCVWPSEHSQMWQFYKCALLIDVPFIVFFLPPLFPLLFFRLYSVCGPSFYAFFSNQTPAFLSPLFLLFVVYTGRSINILTFYFTRFKMQSTSFVI